MRGEKGRKTEKEVREAIHATATVGEAARLLGVSLWTLSARLNRAGMRGWWLPLKARRKRFHSAARRRRTWNRKRDRELVRWLYAHREGFRARAYLSTRLRARVERALTERGIKFDPL